MNSTARSLGLTHTRFVDPTGASTGSVSTPGDLIRLGEAAMTIPTFRAIVAMPQVTLPVAGVLYNLDVNLGQGGFVGMKTGADSASGGSYLFAAAQVVAGQRVVLVGAVLDQRYPDPTAAALYVGDLLAAAAFRAMAPLPLFAPGERVGRLGTPWGPSSPVLAARPVSVVGIPGLSVPVRVARPPLPRAVAEGTTVGVLRVDTATGTTKVDLVTARAVPGPSVLWHLTRR
jgi:serine-type D-Ala-D-Ala carboxypeptidase (penicillin-binding protein 5/6)